MKRKFLTVVLAAAFSAAALSGCANNTADDTSVVSTEGTGSDAETEAETIAISDIYEDGTHDASEKENTYADDLTAARTADQGSTETLEGKYEVDGVLYVFEDDTLYIIEEGEYYFDGDEIVLNYAGAELAYAIQETDYGFNLLAGESTLIPLVYMEGEDGLTASDLFDGIYAIQDAQGYVFNSDGTLDIVIVHECDVKKKTVTFAGST